VVFSYSTLSSDRPLSAVDDDLGRFAGHRPRPVLEVFPQPSNPELSIRFAVPVKGHTNIGIYNINGQLVRTLVSAPMEPGLYFARWDGADQHGVSVASGVYFCRLEVGSVNTVRKVVLVR